MYFSWFYGKISRTEAQKFLLSPANRHGAFLIRKSESARDNYALSVRDGDVDKHYRIRALDNNLGFFITRKSEFTTLQDLVEHYKKEADGLCDKLSVPCSKVRLYNRLWREVTGKLDPVGNSNLILDVIAI